MGDWKVMLPYRGGTLLDSAIENARTICQRILLVGGYRYNELKARYQNDATICLLYNPYYQDGLLSSVKIGLAEIKTDYFFIAHGDMPCLYPRFYELLSHHMSYTAIFPGTKEMPGHPVLLSKMIIPAVLEAPPDSTMREIIIKTSNPYYVGLTDPFILHDIDTPELYKALLKIDK